MGWFYIRNYITYHENRSLKIELNRYNALTSTHFSKTQITTMNSKHGWNGRKIMLIHRIDSSCSSTSSSSSSSSSCNDACTVTFIIFVAVICANYSLHKLITGVDYYNNLLVLLFAMVDHMTWQMLDQGIYSERKINLLKLTSKRIKEKVLHNIIIVETCSIAGD